LLEHVTEHIYGLRRFAGCNQRDGQEEEGRPQEYPLNAAKESVGGIHVVFTGR